MITVYDVCLVHKTRGIHGMYRYFHYIHLPECDGRGVQGSGTYSPWRADPRLLVIPSLWCRVADINPNWGVCWRLAPTFVIATYCVHHCNTCVAQFIRVMRTWRHPFLPPVYHWRSPESVCTGDGFRSFGKLIQHVTTRADDSHATPVKRCFMSRTGKVMRVVSN